MKTYRLARDQIVPRPLEETFAFFADSFNLETLTPPWLRVRVLTAPPIQMRRGTEIDYRLHWRGLPLFWRSRIEEWTENRCFVDVQIQGPYSTWFHLHTFEAAPGGTRVRDIVTYSLPLCPLAALVRTLVVGPDLERIFDYRARRIEEMLGAPAPLSRGWEDREVPV